MQIKEFAARTGASPRAVRYYEEKGLLAPDRASSGYRRFTEHHVETVRRIRFLLTAGLNTEVVREVLPCMVGDGRFLAPACEDLIPEFERELERITGQIHELAETRSVLASIIDAGRQPSAPALSSPAADGDRASEAASGC